MIRVAGIGAGYFSQFHYEAWQRLARVSLCAIVDLDGEKAQAAAGLSAATAYTDIELMLTSAKPDLIDIVAPPQSHLALIRALSGHVATIICQKPFTTSIGEACEAIGLAKAAGTLLIVHENFRFEPWYRRIQTHLMGASLGEIYQATFRLRPGDGQGPDAYLSRQPYFQKMPRFLVHETAIHMIDVFRFLFGEMTTVYADLRRLNPAIVGEDSGYILMEFASGVRALFDGNRLVDHAAANKRLTMGELSIEGEAGLIGLDGDGGLWTRRMGANNPEQLPYSWNNIGFGGDSVHALQQHVISHILDGSALENSAQDYLRNLQIEDAVYQSSKSGRRITL
ncbi:MAG: Gfo/Idh/MocA family protein [Alphaproteobacteria bacterium]